MGLINNFPYVVVLSASKSIAEELNNKDLLSLFSGSMVLFGVIVRFLNSVYLVKI